MSVPPYPTAPVPTYFRHAQWKAGYSNRNGVHYVGDDVVLEWTFSDANYDHFKRTSSFDYGLDGSLLATTDRGSKSRFSAITGTPKYSSAHAHSGSLSMKLTADGTNESFQWNVGKKTNQFYRWYVYLTAAPTNYTSVAKGGSWTVGITPQGYPYMQDQFSGSTIMSTPHALNAWIRLEFHLDSSGQAAELRLYNDPDSLTATETITDATFACDATGDGLIRMGPGTANAGSPYWLDDIAGNADDWLGPLGDAPIVSALDYEVRDYFGNIVSEGRFEEGDEWFVVTPPGGGWSPGWYRVYLTGPQSDTNFANSYGATNFCFIKNDAHFNVMPATSVGNGGIDGDFVMKGVMGLGTSRMTIDNANAPTTGGGTIANAVAQAAVTGAYWSDNGISDSERPERSPWCAFPNGAIDSLWVSGDPTGMWGRIYPATPALSGSQLFITVSAGTNPNTDKVRVYWPDSATLVETFDNIPSGSAAPGIINGSNYIRMWNYGAARAAYSGPTAIGWAYHDGVVDVVSTLYPLGVTRFEGPSNEDGARAETAHHMRLFQGSVHDGNASAKAIGPCFVAIPPTMSWTAWLDAGGGSYCDEISFHAYNAIRNGNMNMGKYVLGEFQDVLASYGLGSKVLWQTESTNTFTSVYRVYHPRRARVPVMMTLLWEQFGVPSERNIWWYDLSQGFWDYPSWLENGDGSLEPHVVLGRVLAEETWGKPFASTLDFGELGNAIYLGNVYTNAAGTSTIALMAASYMTGASIVLTISGTSNPITVVDGFGNEKTMAQSKGRITIPMTDIPAYVRLPSGASASVYRINGWSPLGIGASIASSATTKQIDGVTYAAIADGGHETTPDAGIVPSAGAPPPSDTTIIWDNATTIERVIVWCGQCWSIAGTMIDFDVQTYDGASWTTRKTVTKESPPYFYFGTDQRNSGCWIETFWDEQWVFDVELDQAVSCLGVRLHVREASYGGEPLSDQGGMGQGNNVQAYKIQEIAVADVNRYAGVA